MCICYFEKTVIFEKLLLLLPMIIYVHNQSHIYIEFIFSIVSIKLIVNVLNFQFEIVIFLNQWFI